MHINSDAYAMAVNSGRHAYTTAINNTDDNWSKLNFVISPMSSNYQVESTGGYAISYQIQLEISKSAAERISLSLDNVVLTNGFCSALMEHVYYSECTGVTLA